LADAIEGDRSHAARTDRHEGAITVLGTIIAALILVIVVLVRRIYVYRLQKQIDELDRLRGAGAVSP